MVGSGTCAGGGDIGADIALWCCGAVGVVLGVGAGAGAGGEAGGQAGSGAPPAQAHGPRTEGQARGTR